MEEKCVWMRFPARWLAAVASLAAGVCGLARAGEYVVPVRADTSIYSGSFNGGIDTRGGGKNTVGIYVGDNLDKRLWRGLLRFPVAGKVEGAAAVTGAVLRVTVSSTDKIGSSLGDFPVYVHAIHSGNAAWVEDSEEGSRTVEAHGVCWEALKRNQQPWFGGAGGGCLGEPLATVTVAVNAVQVGDVYELPFPSAGIELVRSWIGGAPNAGILLKTAEQKKGMNAIAFVTRHDENATVRPCLVLKTAAGDVEVVASDDTFIMHDAVLKGAEYGDFNYGQSPRLGVGVNNEIDKAWQPVRSLLRFDVGSFGGEVVTGAVLRLVVQDVANRFLSADALTVSLARVANAHADWQPGAKNETLASTGELTWNWLRCDEAMWPGNALPPQPGEELASRSFASKAELPVNTVVEIPVTNRTALARIQAWSEGEANEGFWLLGNEGRPSDNQKRCVYFHSMECANAAWRPQLVVYTQKRTRHVVAPASADNFLYNGPNPWNNSSWGKWATPQLCVGLNNATAAYRALLRFDLADSANRHLRAERAELVVTPQDLGKIGTGTFELRLHLLEDANAAWVEGTGDASVVTGDPCWNFLAHNGTPWVGGAGIGADATSDGIALTAATLPITASAVKVGEPITLSITNEAALKKIDDWMRGRSNAGFLLTTCESTGRQNALQIASREHGTASWRPMLHVYAVEGPQNTCLLIR